MAQTKRSRFEGFIHQKIDRNLQTALNQLAKLWNVPESEVPRTAILNAAMDAALKAETKNLPATRRTAEKDSKRENERLSSELQTLSSKSKNFERQKAELRKTLEAALRTLDKA